LQDEIECGAGGCYFHLVTELCAGGDLFNYVELKGALSEMQTKQATLCLINGLIKLHSHNVCHRDLKPENVMFSEPEDFATMKIIDFGLAKQLDQGCFMTTRIGTPYYVSPEVLKGDAPYDIRCDLWSCGIIVFFMLHGYPPFTASSERQLFHKILQGDVVFSCNLSA
jgi:calcium-dependent protein kinase